MANRNDGALRLLVRHSVIERGGDETELGQIWDPVQTGHGILLPRLGNRLTEDTPLRLLWRKTLTGSDVDSHQNRFVIPINDAEDSFFRCLSLEQRQHPDREAIQVRGFDEQGRDWQLQFKKRKQRSNGSISYAFLGDWTRMSRGNGWERDTEVKIWGFPYGGILDQWEYGPEHGVNEIYVVITSNL